MRTVISFLFCTLLYFNAAAQEVTAIIAEAKRLEAIPSEKAAFNKLKEALKIQPTNLFALIKCSELCSRIGKREIDKDSRNSYYKAAEIYAGTALKVSPTNAEANAVMAIAVGMQTMLKSGKEKIAAVRDIKKYGDLAVKYDPNNFKAWHVLGKWFYEVSNLNMFERAAAKVFYGGLPAASLQESIDAYEKARSLNGTFLLNYLELAKAYKRNDNKDKAIALLKTIPTLPDQTEDDPIIRAEAKKLLEDLQ